MASLRHLFDPLYEDGEAREKRHHSENLAALKGIEDQLKALVIAVQMIGEGESKS